MADRPTRTLLISPFFDAGLPSGGAFFSVEVAREWLRRGRSVAVVCARRERSLGDLEPAAHEGRLALHPLIGDQDVRFTHHPNQALQEATAELIRAFRPDVIHVHNTQGMLSAMRAALDSGVPTILTALDFGLICFNFCLYPGRPEVCAGPESAGRCADCVMRDTRGPARRIGRMLPRGLSRRLWPRFVRLAQALDAQELHAMMRHLLRGLDAVVAPCPSLGERLARFGAREEHVTTLLYGLPPEAILRPAKTPAESLRFAYFGGPDPLKGFTTIVEAVRLLPASMPLEIRAYGDDRLRDRLTSLGPEVRRYLQHRRLRTGAALAAEHAGIDAVLVPSIIHENSPFAVLMSLANGSPVIASDMPGLNHLILPERNGLLVRAGHPPAWAAALVRAVQRPAVIRRMQADARFDRTTADFVDDLRQVEDALAGRRWAPRPDEGEAPGPCARAFL